MWEAELNAKINTTMHLLLWHIMQEVERKVVYVAGNSAFLPHQIRLQIEPHRSNTFT